MCPILQEIYQKHTNNLKKIVFIFLNNRREETVTETHSVSPGLRLSLLVKFFPLLWLDVSHTGCSITSHKFLMSHSPVTFNCVRFLLPDLSWAGGGGGGWWQQWDPGQARWQRPLHNESFVEHRAPPLLNEGWVLATVNQDQQHFLFGKHSSAGQTTPVLAPAQPQVLPPMSTYIFITSVMLPKIVSSEQNPDWARFYRRKISLQISLTFEKGRYNEE